jgi:HlyD family secretion protein
MRAYLCSHGFRLCRPVAALCLVSVLAVGSGCSGAVQGADDTAAGVRNGQQYTGELVVRQGDFRQILILSGELRAVYGYPVVVPDLPDRETTIRWIVEDGSEVAEGDRLVELDTAQIASQLEDKESARLQKINELASQTAEVAKTLAEREFAVERARIDFERAVIDADVPEDVQSRRLFQEAQLALEQVRVAHEKAVADLAAFQEASASQLEVLNVELAQAAREVEEAQRAIETMVLEAPRNGIVVVGENRREDRKFQAGDMVWVGYPVLEIPDLSAMMVEARLSDVDDGKIAEGMRTVCTLDTYPDSPVAGVVTEISPVAHESGRRSMQRYFRVAVNLDTSDPELMRPGMSVKVEVETTSLSDVVLAPRQALAFEGDGVYVILARGGRQPVQLGPCNVLECVLEDGPPVGTTLGSRRWAF